MYVHVQCTKLSLAFKITCDQIWVQRLTGKLFQFDLLRVQWSWWPRPCVFFSLLDARLFTSNLYFLFPLKANSSMLQAFKFGLRILFAGWSHQDSSVSVRSERLTCQICVVEPRGQVPGGGEILHNCPRGVDPIIMGVRLQKTHYFVDYITVCFKYQCIQYVYIHNAVLEIVVVTFVSTLFATLFRNHKNLESVVPVELSSSANLLHHYWC